MIQQAGQGRAKIVFIVMFVRKVHFAKIAGTNMNTMKKNNGSKQRRKVMEINQLEVKVNAKLLKIYSNVRDEFNTSGEHFGDYLILFYVTPPQQQVENFINVNKEEK